ncbi:hypothetical protein BAE44_0016895 [Dichanthelium oligosanthes]|uniref:Glabrous enhancer-binding protein-like DBD domain-containing protein n=1 Tax=Dichanthelium oligosanthes TaxID=888268 RepID=A0A1E5VAN9_9POAL|nr:hypothetical protein BAE44_0016895 [Dichanthelium oligosanthes]
MAAKRSAPQSPPPAASSEETASGSGSEESEEEEEIAYSPPPAVTPKTKAPPPQKAQEYEEDEEEGEEDDEEEEEEDEKANHVAPPPAKKNPSPPPPNREESETSGEEEEEETDDEAPQPKPAPNQEAEGKGAKPSSVEDKKPGAPFQRTWSTDDEVRILEAMAAHCREHGTPPQPEALLAALAGSLDNSGSSLALLQGKVRNLKRRYSLAAKRGELPSKDHDRRLFDLSKSVWGPVAAANGGARREVGEMCELYPYLAEEVRAVEKEYPGLFKREFEMIDDDKARALDEKIKKQRRRQMRVLQRRHDLTKEVTRTLIDLVD